MSTSVTGRPSNSIWVSIESRVVPATSVTITRSSPSSLFTSDDLPAFGRPITASRTVVSATSVDSGTRSAIASSRSPVPSPCAAETGIGSPRPSL